MNSALTAERGRALYNSTVKFTVWSGFIYQTCTVYTVSLKVEHIHVHKSY